MEKYSNRAHWDLVHYLVSGCLHLNYYNQGQECKPDDELLDEIYGAEDSRRAEAEAVECRLLQMAHTHRLGSR